MASMEMKEQANALELAAAAGNHAEIGYLLAAACGTVSKMLCVLADADPGLAEGIQKNIHYINKELFSEVGQANIHRNYSYDTPKSVSTGVSENPNEELLNAQKEGSSNAGGGPADLRASDKPQADEHPGTAASVDENIERAEPPTAEG